MNNESQKCQNCTSTNLVKSETKYNKTFERQCHDCGDIETNFEPNLAIDINDIKALLVHCRDAYPTMSVNDFKSLCINDYLHYWHERNNPMTFSEWVNGQILVLT